MQPPLAAAGGDSFMVIDPNDRMKVMSAHGMSPFGDRIPHCVCPFQ
jgi:hypothetical protein